MTWFPALARGDLVVRPMRSDEYGLYAEWRNRPHVRHWWDPDDPPMTVEEAERECAPAVTGDAADRAGIIEFAGRPVGFIQFYPWDAYRNELEELALELPAGAWGLDIFLGEADVQSAGVGSGAVRLVAEYALAAESASMVAFGVAEDNRHARRAYERAGFAPDREFLDLDTRDGVRVRSRLMVLMPASVRPERDDLQ